MCPRQLRAAVTTVVATSTIVGAVAGDWGAPLVQGISRMENWPGRCPWNVGNGGSPQDIWGCLGVSGALAEALGVPEQHPGPGGPGCRHAGPTLFFALPPCRGKPAWKALLGRLAPSAPRGPQGNLGLTACEGSPALW